MFIDANLITALIEKYEKIAAGSGEAPITVWRLARAVVLDLEGLIDAEAARMEKMADDFEAEEYGRFEREDSIIQREVDFNWPHGV